MLIGFIGKMGSGKSTACEYLSQSYGFINHNFKDGLDSELMELYPEVLLSLGGQAMTQYEVLKRKPTTPAVRELKQKHGTEVRRKQDPEYWVKKWLEKYETMFGKNVCVDDVRFPNEVDAIKRLGGYIVRIKRNDITDTGDHESETALDNYKSDFTIEAEKGDHLLLYMALDKIIESDGSTGQNDTTDGEVDGDNSGAYDEYAQGTNNQGR